jgi:hypothetical protein
MPNFLNRYFPESQPRLVGFPRANDSGYVDIVRFYGKEAIHPQKIPIFHQSDLYTLSDTRIASFAKERVGEMKQAGRLYDGPFATRIVSAQFTGSSPVVTVQPCHYADQAGTCFSLDWQDDRFAQYGGTLREYYKHIAQTSSFSAIPFPLCFGVCGLLLIRNAGEPDAIILMHRSGKLASLERSIGPSMAGAIDYDEQDRTLLTMLERSAAQEISEELVLEEDEYQLIPLAFAREIFRGERPQLFCLVVTNVRRRSIVERLWELQLAESEFVRFECVLLMDGGLSEPTIASLNHEAKMSYWLMQEYLAVEQNR